MSHGSSVVTELCVVYILTMYVCTKNVLTPPAVYNGAYFHLEIPNQRGDVAPASVTGTQNEDIERHACGRTVAGFISTLCSCVQMGGVVTGEHHVCGCVHTAQWCCTVKSLTVFSLVRHTFTRLNALSDFYTG